MSGEKIMVDGGILLNGETGFPSRVQNRRLQFSSEGKPEGDTRAMSGARTQTREDQWKMVPEHDRNCFVCLALASRLSIMKPSGCRVKSVSSMKKTGNQGGSADCVIFVNFIDTCPDLRHLPGQKTDRQESGFSCSPSYLIKPCSHLFCLRDGIERYPIPRETGSRQSRG